MRVRGFLFVVMGAHSSLPASFSLAVTLGLDPRAHLSVLADSAMGPRVKPEDDGRWGGYPLPGLLSHSVVHSRRCRRFSSTSPWAR
jgi:hypothetical protein